jgi:hypothetical protein
MEETIKENTLAKPYKKQVMSITLRSKLFKDLKIW